VTDLQPCDLCVIIRPARLAPGDATRALIGKTVILLEAYTPHEPWVIFAPGRFWRVSGLPSDVLGVSETFLKKIPPAPMDDDSVRSEARRDELGHLLGCGLKWENADV
jgi:hypothetical protein